MIYANLIINFSPNVTVTVWNIYSEEINGFLHHILGSTKTAYTFRFQCDLLYDI